MDYCSRCGKDVKNTPEVIENCNNFKCPNKTTTTLDNPDKISEEIGEIITTALSPNDKVIEQDTVSTESLSIDVIGKSFIIVNDILMTRKQATKLMEKLEGILK